MAKKESRRPNERTELKGGSVKCRQAFSFNAPAALSVMLVGDFTKWQREAIALQERGDGCWHVEVELAPGTYHYRFLVDGEWRDDPECAVRVPNPYGGENSVREVV